VGLEGNGGGSEGELVGATMAARKRSCISGA
jgi:hypothetical protein